MRGAAAQTLSVVFEAACSYGESNGDMSLSMDYLPLITKSLALQIPDEDLADTETVHALADSLSETCRMMYLYGLRGALQETDAKLIVHSCINSLKACLERRSTICLDLSGQAFDEDERQELVSLLRHEEEVLTPLVDSVGYTLKVLAEAFLPIFESDVAPVLQPYLSVSGDVRARHAAICLFDDCVEHCGSAAAARFGPSLVEGIINGINDSTNGQDVDLKRAAIYGIAQVARYAPVTVLQPHAQTIVQQLLLITNTPKDQSPDSAVYENAVSALASLVLFDNAPFRTSSYVKRDTVMKSFLAALPLREDDDEAKICSEGLRVMLENGSIDMQANGESVVRAITETLHLAEDGEDIATAATCDGLSSFLGLITGDVHAGQSMTGFANRVSP